MKRVYVSPALKVMQVHTVYQLCQNSQSSASAGEGTGGGGNSGEWGGGDNGGGDAPDGAKAFNVWDF
ncbi:MAG: hypothetical protein IKI83_07625 [Prevotella sp.]|nr:hypothetical protein [Prevotella sp.]